MDALPKVLILLALAPFWLRPLRVLLEEITRVATRPEGAVPPLRSESAAGDRDRRSEGPFRTLSSGVRGTRARDGGRVTNARWETGRRPARSRAAAPAGHPFPALRRPSDERANTTHFGAGRWQGGFGRR